MSVTIVNPNLTFSSPLKKRSTTTYLILHHSASESTSAETVHQWHLAKAWAGIGYNFYIRQDGTIYMGRDWAYQGAHTTNYNSKSIGICFEGNFQTTSKSMPEAQYNAGVALIAEALSRYPTIKKIAGHRVLSSTACPGQYFPLDNMIVDGQSDNISSSGSPSSSDLTSTSNFSNPSSGDGRIKTFQTWVNTNYAIGLTIDGIYGSETKAGATKGYQKELGVAQDGIFGVKSCAAVKTLRNGSSGNSVYLLQGMLYCRGYNPQGLDGKYGANTKAAVKAFQAANGLTTDGLAGKNTMANLYG